MGREVRYSRQLILVPLENQYLIVHLDKITLPSFLALPVCSSWFHPLVQIDFCDYFWKICSTFKIQFRSVSFIQMFVQHKFTEDWYPALFLEPECSEQDKTNLTYITHSFIIPSPYSLNISHTPSSFSPHLYLSSLNFVCSYGSTTQFTANYHSFVCMNLVFLAKLQTLGQGLFSLQAQRPVLSK